MLRSPASPGEAGAGLRHRAASRAVIYCIRPFPFRRFPPGRAVRVIDSHLRSTYNPGLQRSPRRVGGPGMPEKVRPQVESPRFPNPRTSRGAPPKNAPVLLRVPVNRRGPHRYRSERAPEQSGTNRGGTTEDQPFALIWRRVFLFSHPSSSPSPLPPPILGGGRGWPEPRCCSGAKAGRGGRVSEEEYHAEN